MTGRYVLYVLLVRPVQQRFTLKTRQIANALIGHGLNSLDLLI